MSKILLIDDDPDILKMGTLVLSTVGHIVTTAQDALAAGEILKSGTFELIISDANMPKISGFDLVKAIRSERRFLEVPIALLTARRDRKDVETAMAVGVNDYIVKPIDPPLLLQKVQTLLKKNPGIEINPVSSPEEFKGIDVDITGNILTKIEIRSISEIGIRIKTAQKLKEGESITIGTSLFDEIGFKKSPLLKVVGCMQDPQGWLCRCDYIGLSESQLQKIRAWLNSRFIKTNSAKAA